MHAYRFSMTLTSYRRFLLSSKIKRWLKLSRHSSRLPLVLSSLPCFLLSVCCLLILTFEEADALLQGIYFSASLLYVSTPAPLSIEFKYSYFVFLSVTRGICSPASSNTFASRPASLMFSTYTLSATCTTYGNPSIWYITL